MLNANSPTFRQQYPNAIIREVDGGNRMGTAALAEAILAHAVIAENEYGNRRNDEQSRRHRWRSVRAWAVGQLLSPDGEV